MNVTMGCMIFPKAVLIVGVTWQAQYLTLVIQMDGVRVKAMLMDMHVMSAFQEPLIFKHLM